MFSSGNNGNPFSYTNQTLFTDQPTIEENPIYNSSQEEYPPPAPLLLDFPSPFDPPQDNNMKNINTCTTTTTSNCRPRKRKGSGGDATAIHNPNPNPNSRRRTGKKDRHSKISTAQGVRDRRMRLSVQIARKFFDLQDMLGFDKASKTIEWLFSKSKGAIKEVVNLRLLTPESPSPCLPLDYVDKGKRIQVSVVGVPIEEKCQLRRKAASYDPHQVKESRDKARERARARTWEKMMMRKEDDLEGNPNTSLDHEYHAENFHGTTNANSSTSRLILGVQSNAGVSDGEDSNSRTMNVINSDYGDLTNIAPSPMTDKELQEQYLNLISATSAYFQSQLTSWNQCYCWWQ